MNKFNTLIFGLVILCSSTAQSAVEHGDVSSDHVYCVILAGGNGERLWPLSRHREPKQLLHVGDAGSLLDQAIDRVTWLTSPDHIWISTTQQHEQKIHEAVGHRVGKILAEPGSRNTGPAIAYCCLEVAKVDPHAVVIFLPADPFIPAADTQKCAAYLKQAVKAVSTHDVITLLGVKPTFPATGYGYIEYNKGMRAPFAVNAFREKPQLEKAKEYIGMDTMLWNIGIFCAKVSVFIEEFAEHAPQMFSGVQAFVRGQASYNAIISDSIDYAVMEKSKRVTVIPVDFNWCDVGNLEIFLSLKAEFGGGLTEPIAINAHNNLVDVANKRVALIGVDDLCIVETDDVLLIVPRVKAEQVKAVVKYLKETKLAEYL